MPSTSKLTSMAPAFSNYEAPLGRVAPNNLAKVGTRRLEQPPGSQGAAGTNRCLSQLATRLCFLQTVKQLGDRLTVGQRTLTPPVLVRIQVPQPVFSMSYIELILIGPDHVGTGANSGVQNLAFT
jgi:hypothetical protein